MGGGRSSKFLLPESVLDFQRCTHCKKYLSCPPIKVFHTGEIICGRCSKIFKSDGKLGTRSTIYENMVKQTMFPCINRFEGCSLLLEYDKVLNHEEECHSTLYECPACPKGVYEKNCLLHLIDHYKKRHKELSLTEPTIMLSYDNKPRPKHYLYINSNKLVLLNVSYTGCTLMLHASVPWKNPALVAQKVEVFENQEKPLFVSAYKPCNAFSKTLECNSNDMEINRFFIDNIYSENTENRNVWCRFKFEFSENITRFDHT